MTSSYRIYQTEKTRQKIIAGAKRLFVEQGIADTQMKDVAAYVGVSRPSLYRYFQDKTELGFAVQTEVLNELSRKAEAHTRKLQERESLNARELLVKATLDMLSPDGREMDHRFLAEFDSYQSGPRLRADFTSHLPEESGSRLFGLFYSIARIGIEDGSIRSDQSPKQVVLLVLYTLQSVAYRLLVRGEALFELTEDERGGFLEMLANTLQDGLKPG